QAVSRASTFGGKHDEFRITNVERMTIPPMTMQDYPGLGCVPSVFIVPSHSSFFRHSQSSFVIAWPREIGQQAPIASVLPASGFCARTVRPARERRKLRACP